MKKDIIYSVLTYVHFAGLIGVVLWALIFLLIGCHSGNHTPNIPIKPEIKTIIQNISWVQGILIIGIVGSIFACFNGAAKIGVPLLISSLVGFGLTSALIVYAKLVATLSLIGGITLCGYTIYIKSKALREIVKGGEILKTLDDKVKELFKQTQDNVQTDTTKKIVEKIQKGI